MRDLITSLRREVWVDKTRLNPPLYIYKCLYLARKVSGHTIFLFEFGTVSMVWQVLFYILYFNYQTLFQNTFSSEEYRCGPCGESLDIHHSLEDILYFPVVQNVSAGDTLNISIKSVHGGQLYFRLCEIFEMDKCFTRQKLYILESEDYVYNVTYEDLDINLTIQLPDNATASRYVLQWNFVSGMST